MNQDSEDFKPLPIEEICAAAWKNSEFTQISSEIRRMVCHIIKNTPQFDTSKFNDLLTDYFDRIEFVDAL